MFDVCRNDHPRHWRTRIMSILVTGSAGFIGSNFIRLMIDETDERLVSYDALTYAGNLDNLTGISDTRHQFICGDICDIKKLKQVLTEHDVSSIVHFAAESHVDRSIMSSDPFVQSNGLKNRYNFSLSNPNAITQSSANTNENTHRIITS